jgi:mannose-6-phosphate isomerase-like protein (cupin superfamily)
MPYEAYERKGIKTCLVDASLDPEKLRLHISEAAPGGRLHAPHTHDSIEAFYILEGQAGVEFEGKQVTIGPNEVFILDATRPHGLANVGTTKLRYIVIIAKT